VELHGNQINVSQQKEEMPKKECPETPLLDLSDAAVKDLIRSAKKRGYVTYDQINALLSSQEVKSEQIASISTQVPPICFVQR
jgi:RNA polymerase primary sigma factor